MEESQSMYQKHGKYFVQYQVKESSEKYPSKTVAEEHIRTNEPSWMPSPKDSVLLTFYDKPELFIVLSRRFSYEKSGMSVNIVVRPATGTEIEQSMGT